MVLAFAVPARHVFHLAGAWRKVYAATASIALYLNVFVLVAQLFMKVPSLHALAPTGSGAALLDQPSCRDAGIHRANHRRGD